MSIKARVTQELIDAGVPCDQDRCPVAAALSGAVGVPLHVGNAVIRDHRFYGRHWRMTPELAGWIVRYGARPRMKVEPITVELTDDGRAIILEEESA